MDFLCIFCDLGPLVVVNKTTGQASHQLLVGVEVVDPGEIVARKDVLRFGFGGRDGWMWCLKTTQKTWSGSQVKTQGTLGLLNIFIPRITHIRKW